MLASRLPRQSWWIVLYAFLAGLEFTTTAHAQEKPAAPVKLDREGNPLPTHAVMRLGSLRFRTENSIETLALSPDNRWVAAATVNNEICLFERATGKIVSRWKSREHVHQLAFSPDSK